MLITRMKNVLFYLTLPYLADVAGFFFMFVVLLVKV
jgi:hypothetical protein